MNSKLIEKCNKHISKKPNVKKVNTDKFNVENNQNKKNSENKRKTEYIPASVKINSQINFINENQIQKHIKSIQANKQRKRQNLFLKNKSKVKESSNLNLYINKIVNNKENSKIKKSDKRSSLISDLNKNSSSNAKNDNYNNINNELHKTYKTNFIKKKRFDSDLSNTNSDKLSKIISNNISIKISVNKNKINRLSPKLSKNFALSNILNNDKNLLKIHNKEAKLNIKTKKPNNNLVTKKINNTTNSEFLINNIKGIKIKSDKNEKNLNIKIISKSGTKAFSTQNKNKKLFYTNENNNNINKNIENDKKEKVIKENLHPVKKSLFTEHMNFLINYTNDKILKIERNQYENNYNKNNNANYINNPANNFAQSIENKEFESKFINYDLGKTTGTSQIKNSMIVFGNEDSYRNNEISKMRNILNAQNSLLEEKERTKDELERLAEQYLNISRDVANKNDENKFQNSQMNTNTITTIIDNNEDSL